MTTTVDNGPSLFNVKQINFKQKCYHSALSIFIPTSHVKFVLMFSSPAIHFHRNPMRGSWKANHAKWKYNFR